MHIDLRHHKFTMQNTSHRHSQTTFRTIYFVIFSSSISHRNALLIDFNNKRKNTNSNSISSNMEKSSHFLFSFYLVENTKSFYISMIFSVFQFDAIRVPKHKIHAHFERETNVTNVEFHFNRKTPSSATRESSNK